MKSSVRKAIEEALGCSSVRQTPLSGGDINDACALHLSDGREIFVKTNKRADPLMFPAEAAGLRWLANADALRIPQVIAADPEYLVLELLKPAARVADFDDRLGQGLAAVHKKGPKHFGHDIPNFLATLSQDNSPCDTWATFYAERRLLPQVRWAVDAGHAPKSWHQTFDTLCAKLVDLVGPDEPPARLHGDLWGGNLHVDEKGEPALIDPAVYGGHREIDLAMMKLFGGFSARVFETYNEAYPLAPGHSERVRLYQLYPLLAHVNLFGSSYVSSVDNALRSYL